MVLGNSVILVKRIFQKGFDSCRANSKNSGLKGTNLLDTKEIHLLL